MNKDNELTTTVASAKKNPTNPFVDDVFKIDSKKKTIIAGKTNKILMDGDTGEIEGVAMLHRYKEVDQEKFIKLYLSEVSSLFELTRSGIKVFGYILSLLKVNSDEIYIHIPNLMLYCGYTSKYSSYKALGELLSNKIIAMSTRPNIWFINPNILFNGDRIAFIKEYRLIKRKVDTSEQLLIAEFMKNKE